MRLNEFHDLKTGDLLRQQFNGGHLPGEPNVHDLLGVVLRTYVGELSVRCVEVQWLTCERPFISCYTRGTFLFNKISRIT